ncbi:MAG TPA: c-type cytochrome domain-containing protein [Verrucomicrobiae bacterium]|nr:c-type cytochrome domain-containing protein [Verrucomicrobiae bacterium]
MNIKTTCLLTAMCLNLVAFAKDVDVSKLPPPSDRKDVTYQNDIKPILEQSCVKCHGVQKPKAKLRLDSLEGVLKGGADGKVVDPGNSAKSLLVINVAHLGHEDDFMPPPNNKMKIQPLTAEQIGVIRAWIDQGAK